jgi:hypothetical protein
MVLRQIGKHADIKQAAFGAPKRKRVRGHFNRRRRRAFFKHLGKEFLQVGGFGRCAVAGKFSPLIVVPKVPTIR